MSEKEKNVEINQEVPSMPEKQAHREASERSHSHHHHHHHRHHSHQHHHTQDEDKKAGGARKFKRFLRKNKKDILIIAIVVVVAVALWIRIISSTESWAEHDGPSDGSISSPSASGNTSNTTKQNDTYRFSTVNSVCDAYSNQAGKISIPQDEKNRYIDPVNEIYALYDGLVSAYPEYVSRTLLGTVISGEESYPLYRYDFKPPMLMGSKTEDMCKILYCSGTHGGEIPPVLQGFRFFKDLCTNWRNQDLLRTLRFNCHFTVIPLVNPYGIQHVQKSNANGVNLNRNFSNEWIFVADDGTTSSPYSGETPASELETQWIEAMTASERFDFGIDHHTFDTFVSSGIAGYFVCNDAARPNDASFADLMGNWISAKVVTNNPYVTDLSKSYFKTTAGEKFNGYVFGAFPAGYCFETVFSWGDAKMEAAYECQKFNAEVLGAMFYTAMETYHTY